VPARLVGREEQLGTLSVLSPPEDEALLDELGGAIDVRAVIDGLAAALADELVSAEVFDARDRDGGVALQTSEGLWEAERAILCPGAGLHALTAELDFHIPLELDLHARAAFRVREPGRSLACLQDRSNVHGETVYAAPMPEGRHYAVGLGGEHEPPADEAVTRLTAYVERALPGLDPEPASVRLCRTSILPWGADAFAVWRAGNVDVLAGANLFKFGPLLGELLANRSDELLPEAQLGRAQAGQAASPSA
jgi:sarcosine oxidase